MNLNINLACLAIFIAFSLCINTLAYGGKQDNWDVYGLNGEVHMNVGLVESPCSLDIASSSTEIDLGSITQRQLNKAGRHSTSIPVHIMLNDCMFNNNVRSTTHGDNLYFIQSQPSVMLKIFGDEDQDEPSLFKIYGDNEGVALRIEDMEHKAIHPGEPSRPQLLLPGRNDLVLYVQLSRTTKPLSAGAFRAVINIELEYN
ncbi:type 1 fimbria pilin [Serratia fonticola]|uniref:Type 1 fimbria pilin n=1 Tax=Serratia fonticola TaxID=47917 RepID=A0A542D963_SERFO|nr:fimbrial protein [Serratia fonticola]TQI78370.1 type 1 fimbria pilin [Serratia fonticola]TQI99608.1 type 1 fimbria pilin [Serratia fonticola]TVZ69131.1 type 1 fimbria pilin [Serratia fonticola]